ncbi:hypothetical protein DPMN_082870 [Dreissena polymorpha]|uniref:Uncharacterized protein n=1 Tax=Dreissena polymorpha TaxID=45954 RepID=A0A9D3YAT6_DREPO|nr:hypothetical protein DPMN_082870 [Dreissena polymorpha]
MRKELDNLRDLSYTMTDRDGLRSLTETLKKAREALSKEPVLRTRQDQVARHTSRLKLRKKRNNSRIFFKENISVQEGKRLSYNIHTRELT